MLSLLFYFPGCETTEPVEKPEEERKWNNVPELSSANNDPIIIIEHHKGKPTVEYGTPGYAQWGGQGVYTYNLN